MKTPAVADLAAEPVGREAAEAMRLLHRSIFDVAIELEVLSELSANDEVATRLQGCIVALDTCVRDVRSRIYG
jgi:hypothetical protein